jgi:glycosyltransferase involved in cell wall biosynthesis
MERNPKVVFIPTPKKNPVTGGEIYNLKLLKFLRKKFGDTESIEVGIFRTKAKKNYEMLFFGLTSIVRNFFYIYAILRKKNNRKTVILEDIYYSTDLFLFNFLIRRIKKNVSTIPIVHHLYYVFAENKFLSTLFRNIEAIFLNESDWIITNSEATEKSIRKLLKKTKKFLVAYPGLDKKKIVGRKTSIGCDHSDSSRGRLNLLAVGSLTKRKDFETLLRAIKILVDRYDEKEFFVNVIGDLEKDRHYSAKILETARALSLSNHVAFRGKIDASELFDFYVGSDIFVSTSLHEGFGIAIAEAMYNHLPVVAANCGAIPYLVQDGVNGFLVPPGDYEQLAEKIVQLLESEQLRKNMGDKGFYKAKQFDWKRTFNKIYGKLLEI